MKDRKMTGFIKLPRVLLADRTYRDVSVEAKVLYALMVDRLGISEMNEWKDEKGEVYIYCTLEEIQRVIGCGHDKACRLLAELDEKTGAGLITRIRQGQGRPTRIYVKTVFEDLEAKTSAKQKAGEVTFGSLDFGKSNTIYTEKNQIDSSYIYQSIEKDWERCREEVPTSVAQGRFRMLDRPRIEYVLDCMRSATVEIRNVRGYLLTALYYAPITMDAYYQAKVQHDFAVESGV